MRALFLMLCGLLLSLAGQGLAHAHGSGAHQGGALAQHVQHVNHSTSIASSEEGAVLGVLRPCASITAMKPIDAGASMASAMTDCGEPMGHCCHSACAVLPAALLPPFAFGPGYAVPVFLAPPPSRGRFAALFRPPRAALA
jgi:hypothetical protein